MIFMFATKKRTLSDEGPSSQEHIGPHVRVYGGARRGSFWGIVSLVVMCQ